MLKPMIEFSQKFGSDRARRVRCLSQLQQHKKMSPLGRHVGIVADLKLTTDSPRSIRNHFMKTSLTLGVAVAC